MADSGFAEKTEKATPKKKEEARKQGQVAHSREVGSVTGLFVALGALAVFIPGMWRRFSASTHKAFSTSVRTPETVDLAGFLLDAIGQVMLMILPLLLAVFVMGFAASALQVGLKFVPEAAVPKASRINPGSGLARIFSLQTLMEMAKSLLKVSAVGLVAWLTVSGRLEELSGLYRLTPAEVTRFALMTVALLFLRCAGVMVIIAVIDVLFVRHSYEKKLMMTKQEVKEEHKQSDGDPLVKGRIRRMQQDMARRRMMEDVKKADVVVTNPQHLACALSYDRLRMKAPVLVAKGAGELARRIREKAAEHGIPVVENKPLARALYRYVDLGRPISEDLYQAVAEVLAYVYRSGRSKPR